jgi:murein DD-endopeptidase MepM/ murein hydrolase activator NlpD
MALDAQHIEYSYDKDRDIQTRSEFLYTMTAADLHALYTGVEKYIADTIPPLTAESVDKIKSDATDTLHCVLLANKEGSYTSRFQQGITQHGSTDGVSFWFLDKADTNQLAQQLWISQQRSGVYIIRQGEVIETIEQPLSATGWQRLVSWLAVDDHQQIQLAKTDIIPNRYDDVEVKTVPQKKGRYDDLVIWKQERNETIKQDTIKPETPPPSKSETTQDTVPVMQQWPILQNGIDVSGMKRYIDGMQVKKIDPYVYAFDGAQIPATRELRYDEKKKMIVLNGVDEGVAYFDKDLVYINPVGVHANRVYTGTELKYGEQLQYKLTVDSRGALRIAFNPTPALLQKYKDDKWFDRKKTTLPELPNLPDFNDLIQQILPEFEGDPNEPDVSVPDIETYDRVENLAHDNLYFNGTKVTQLQSTVYGVPPEWLHKIKATYDHKTKQIRMYEEGARFGTIKEISLAKLEKWDVSVPHTIWFFWKKQKHEGSLRGEIDKLWRLRIYRWDKTDASFDAPEAIAGWTMPFAYDKRFAVTGIFNERRKITKNGKVIGRRRHKWIDIYMPEGTPLMSVWSGVVTEAKDRWGYGLVVEIDHQNGLKTRYAHMSKIDVKVKQKVAAWTIIGKSGHTWWVTWPTGDHLHFEVRVDGVPDNPAKYFDFTAYDRWNQLRWLKPRTFAKETVVWMIEYGKASYYKDWKITHSEKPFDKWGNFCAHNEYPFGTVLRVTNLENGLTTEVIVEDTGGFEKYGRILDLSLGSMTKLWWVRKWVIDVKTEVVKVGDRENPKTKSRSKASPKNAPKKTPDNTSPLSYDIELMKEPPEYVPKKMTRWGKTYNSFSPLLIDNTWRKPTVAPWWWLIDVKNGTPILKTPEWDKDIASSKTVTVAGVSYAISVMEDSKNIMYPKAARFILTKK